MKKFFCLNNGIPKLYTFVILGILLWLLFFALTPATPKDSLSIYTLLFVFSCYGSYFLGYLFTQNKRKLNSNITIKESYLKALIIIITVSWIVRYIDLFYFRNLSFFNTVKENRNLLVLNKHHAVFIPFSILKEAYFLPLLLTLQYFKKKRTLLIFSSIVFIFPLVEPFLRGTRKDILLLLVYLMSVLLVTKTIKFNKALVLKVILAGILLNGIFFKILMNREQTKVADKKTENVVAFILEKARYNDLLQANEEIKAQIDAASGIKKAALFQYLHITQYYTHGLFELDYLIKERRKNPKVSYGAYTFYNVPRFTNILGLTNYDVKSIHKNSPRSHTYITFFGGLYLDFKWFALLIMLLLGMLQKRIDKRINNGHVYLFYFYIFFIIFNILMPVVNIIRGVGMYTLLSGLILLLLIRKLNQEDEKSVST